jgi:hypothetical protein
MSDVKNLWVLKQPIEANEVDNWTVEIDHPEDKNIFHSMAKDAFETFFVPLDVESLTTQLEDILQNFWQDEDQDLDDSVAEVLELIGITKEQK